MKRERSVRVKNFSWLFAIWFLVFAVSKDSTKSFHKNHTQKEKKDQEPNFFFSKASLDAVVQTIVQDNFIFSTFLFSPTFFGFLRIPKVPAPYFSYFFPLFYKLLKHRLQMGAP